MTTADPTGQRADLAIANRILANKNVLDAYGHVSVRDAANPDRFLLARNMAPAAVTQDDVQSFDLDAVTDDPRPPYLERFIHSEVYRARPDVHAVVHSHSPSVLPFTVVSQPLAAISHMAGFLQDGAPVFEIRDVAGDASDLLIRSQTLAASLCAVLGSGAVALMRGHGSVVVGDSLAMVVHRAVFTEMNAKALSQALNLGQVTALTAGEAESARRTNDGQTKRAWDLWSVEAATTAP